VTGDKKDIELNPSPLARGDTGGYETRKLLLTGHSGFLGRTIHQFLLDEGYVVKTLSRDETADYPCDLSKKEPVFQEQFDAVIHAAGLAHFVPKSKKEGELFAETNYHGTRNLCNGLEIVNLPGSFIFISSVAVYGRQEGLGLREESPLDGSDPYSMSKIKAEQFLLNWCVKNNLTLGILRPALIAGANPPGNLGALIEGIKKGKYFRIGKGQAKKSMVLVDDVAKIIPVLMKKGGICNICDDHNPSMREIEGLIAEQLNKKYPVSIPYALTWLLAKLGDIWGSSFPLNSTKLKKLTSTLTFSNEKAKKELGYNPTPVLNNFKSQNS